MPELAANSISDTLPNTGTATSQGPTGSTPHIRELATRFTKKSLITEQDGGLLIKGVPMLASGTWTDSAVRTPLHYPENTLREYASNWVDTSGWSRHSGGVPRDITEKVAEARNLRYEDGAVTADIFVHPHTQKSRDTIELIKRKLISYVSVEHGWDERYNSATRQMEATSLTFSGFAFVNKGACKLCRINERAPQAAERGDMQREQAAPSGSLEELREKLQEAIRNRFGKDDGDGVKYGAWITVTFPDRVIYEVNEHTYEVSFSISESGDVQLGEPTEVEISYKRKEMADFDKDAFKAELVKELSAVMKPVETPKVEIPKELSDLIEKQGTTIKELAERLEKIEKTPAPTLTNANTESRELAEPPRIVVKRGEIYQVN